MRRQAKLAIALVTVLCASLALGASGALALAKHEFSTSFSGEGAAALSNPTEVAIDVSTGDLYVSDPANFRVEKFSSAGAFILTFGDAVNATKAQAGAPASEEDVCTAASGDLCQAGTESSAPGGFVGAYNREGFSGDTLYLALDNSAEPSAGDIYVGDPGDSLISKFDSSGHLLGEWADGGQLDGSRARGGAFSLGAGLAGIAVDPGNGDLLAAAEHNILYRFDPDGAFFSGSGKRQQRTCCRTRRQLRS